MSQSKPSAQKQLISDDDATPSGIVKLSDFEAGQTGDCFALLTEKNQAKTRDGKPYYRVSFRDASRTATAMVWSDSAWFADCDERWPIGGFYKLRCKYSETQYGPQIDIDRIREVQDSDAEDGFDPAGFYRSTRFDIEAMFGELRQTAEEQISDVPLRRLVTELLDENRGAVCRIPAASRFHHAFIGGFLEHVLSVTRTVNYLVDKYAEYYPRMQPPLSKSVAIAGAILHDIGKLIELDYQPHGSGYTAEGKLIGHILLGRDIVRDKAATIDDMDAEILLRLEHLIVAHQNLPEWGSPVAPHTPEALLVYYADDIDAKFHMMARALMEEPQEDEQFTPRDGALRREIFRGLGERKDD
jgi:3'-5' exoribonuclease